MNRLCDVFEDRGVFDRCRIFGVDEAASDEPQRRLIEGNEEPLEEGDDGQALKGSGGRRSERAGDGREVGEAIGRKVGARRGGRDVGARRAPWRHR